MHTKFSLLNQCVVVNRHLLVMCSQNMCLAISRPVPCPLPPHTLGLTAPFWHVPFPLPWQHHHQHPSLNIPAQFPRYMSKLPHPGSSCFLSRPSHLRCSSDVLIVHAIVRSCMSSSLPPPSPHPVFSSVPPSPTRTTLLVSLPPCRPYTPTPFHSSWHLAAFDPRNGINQDISNTNQFDTCHCFCGTFRSTTEPPPKGDSLSVPFFSCYIKIKILNVLDECLI